MDMWNQYHEMKHLEVDRAGGLFLYRQYAITNREFCEFLNDVTEGGVRNPAEGGTSWWKDTSAGSGRVTGLCQPIFTTEGTL